MRNLKAQTTVLAVAFVAIVSLTVGYFYLQSQNPKGEPVSVGHYPPVQKAVGFARGAPHSLWPMA